MKLTLQTITPIHIGSGDILSPYCDYLLHGGEVVYINQKKLSEDLYKRANADEIMDKFVELARTSAGTVTDKYTLAAFFDEHNLDIEQYTQKKIRIMGVIKNEQITRMISTGDKPYIPGSTLKGAIRTCLIYGHMKAEGYSMEKINEFDGKKKNYIGQDIFGEFGWDLLKYLHVTDTDYLSPDQIVIARTAGWDFVKHQFGVPVIREAIPDNVNFEFRLQTKGKRDYHQISSQCSYLWMGNEGEILSRVNNFYIDSLEKEIAIFSKMEPNLFRGVISLYTELHKEAKHLRETKQGAIMRIGAGKTFYENTIGMALNDEDRKNIENQVKIGNAKMFPKTRTVLTEGDQVNGVLGWVRISNMEVK